MNLREYAKDQHAKWAMQCAKAREEERRAENGNRLRRLSRELTERLNLPEIDPTKRTQMIGDMTCVITDQGIELDGVMFTLVDNPNRRHGVELRIETCCPRCREPVTAALNIEDWPEVHRAIELTDRFVAHFCAGKRDTDFGHLCNDYEEDERKQIEDEGRSERSSADQHLLLALRQWINGGN